MSGTLKTILIIVIILILGAGGLLVYTVYQEQQGNETFVSNLFPGSPGGILGGGDNQNNDDIIILPDTDSDTGDTTDTRAQMFQITQSPIVGYTLIEEGDGVIARYMEKGTGNIYDYDIATGNQTKISNKTIDRVQKVIWGEKGDEFITRQITEDDRVLTRYFSFNTGGKTTFFFETTLEPGDNNEEVRNLQKALNEDPETFIATSGVGSPGEESTYYGTKTVNAVKRFQEKYAKDILEPQDLTEGTGVFDDLTREKLNNLFEPQDTITQETKLFEKPLPGNISQIVASPTQDKIFYLLDADEETVSGIVANFDNTNQREIFASPFTDWSISWKNNDALFLTTKPSQEVSGSVYILNPSTGAFNRLLGGIDGLTVNESSRSSLVLYSKSTEQGNGITTHVYDASSDSQEIIPTLATLSEKCVWSNTRESVVYCGIPNNLPVGMYPDDWYKGVIEFSDTIWEYNTNNRVQNIIIDLETQTLTDTIDIYNPSIDRGDNVLLFIDKSNSSLWGLSLN